MMIEKEERIKLALRQLDAMKTVKKIPKLSNIFKPYNFSQIKLKQIVEDRLFESKKIYGFPINLTYSDVEKVWEEIENTDIHEILRNDISFVCATACLPYPNFIISVWVFVGVLID